VKRISILSLLLIGTCTLAEVWAEDWQMITKPSKGTYMEAFAVILTSSTGTALWDADKKRGDAICFNNTAFNIWIGTTTATEDSATHPNILNGFPIASSSTFSLDGGMSGQLYGTCGEDTGLKDPITCELRCLEGLIR